MKIYIGTDHVGYEFKNKLIAYLKNLNYLVEDKGAFIYDRDDDYPDFITPVAESVAKDSESVGIILGGSGQGEAMCANRIKGVRAAVFYATKVPESSIDIAGHESQNIFEIVSLSREHDCANVLSLGMRFISEEEAISAVECFLSTKHTNVSRHLRRIGKF